MFDKKENVEDIDDKSIENIIVFSLMIKNWLIDYIKKLNHTSPKKIKKISDGMNSHSRLSMYDPKQFFGIHKDGINFDKNNKQRMSYATLNIFLNDNFEGGAATFYEKDKSTVKLRFVNQEMGSGSFFYSQQFHEGNKTNINK